MNGYAASGEVRGVGSGAATDIQHAPAGLKERINDAPHSIALSAADGGLGPQLVVAEGEAVEKGSGAQASTSLQAACRFCRTTSASAGVLLRSN